nr:putative nuclease HARBI1 [Pocillopora verrucosa]
MAYKYRRLVLTFACEDFLLLLALVVTLRWRRRQKRRNVKPKRFWVREISRNRKRCGEFHNLVLELRLGDRELYFRYMCMSPESFDHLLSLVSPLILKRTTKLREPVSAAERLALTLRFLPSGNSQQSMSFSYRVGRQTVSSIIKETCRAIWQVLNEKYLRAPSLPDDWEDIAEEFMQLWNCPHCIGAIDGKHIAIECPVNSGSLYHNYKGFFSIVLLAICDAHYIFNFIDIGDYGSNNDSGVLENSDVGKAFANNSLGVPDPAPN